MAQQVYFHNRRHKFKDGSTSSKTLAQYCFLSQGLTHVELRIELYHIKTRHQCPPAANHIKNNCKSCQIDKKLNYSSKWFPTLPLKTQNILSPQRRRVEYICDWWGLCGTFVFVRVCVFVFVYLRRLAGWSTSVIDGGGWDFAALNLLWIQNLGINVASFGKFSWMV